MIGCVAAALSTRADQVIYDDSLQNGWGNWSWAANNFANTNPVHTGSKSISTTANPFEAVAFGHDPLNTSPYSAVSFWVHGGTNGGQRLQVYANTNGVALPGVNLTSLPANTWQQITLSLASLGIERVSNLTQISIQYNPVFASPAVTFYVDDVRLVSDTTPPVVQSVSPVAGSTVSNLTSVTVTFSEPVLGIGASDLRVNSGPADTMTGSGATYTFTFSRPAEGTVNLTWDAAHGITDYGSPANVFDETAPGASWQYTYADTVPPLMTEIFPGGGATIASLRQIEVTFSEDVLGIAAADLLINGAPATNVVKVPGQPYLFQFPQPATGQVTVAWSPAHGITDTAVSPNPFVAAGGWTYTLNTNLPTPDLVVNEILCGNIATNGLADEDGELQEWIELYNRGAQSVNLTNWSLSDDPEIPGQWIFPARTLAPGDYLVVFASGKNRKPAVGQLHTNFKISPGGEPLGLYSPDSPRKLVSGFAPYPEQRNDISYGLDLYGQLRYFATPTPGVPNGFSTITGVVAPVQVNVSRGYFTAPFALAASCATPGAVVNYTVDGSEPTEANAPLPASLTITNTTLFRVAAFKTNCLPSKTTTHTYFFNLPDGLHSLPMCSVVTATNNLFGPTGILGIHGGYYDSNNFSLWVSNAPGDYHNPAQRGVAWERPASVEWINPADNSGFQADCGLRVHGSDFQRPRLDPTDKFSLALFFRGDYGAGQLKYPLFDRTSANSFDHVVLRAGFSEKVNPFIRDELHRRLSQDMGNVAAAGNLAVVFINGVYYTNEFRPWYNPCERISEQFFQLHLGGGDKWDVVGPLWISSGVTDGDRTDFNNLANYISANSATNPAVYTNLARWLDLTNFADYCILNAYSAMGDWPGNNWHAGKDRSKSGPWRFVVWDAENGMGNRGRSITLNSFAMSGTGDTDGGLASVSASEVALFYQKLRVSPEFRLLWADRIQKHFFNGGALTGGSITNRFMEMRNQLYPLMGEMDNVLLVWARDRQGIFFSQMEPYGLTAYTNAPGFGQFGGPIPPGYGLVITNTGGAIYYTTNGSDPRTAFTGAVSPTAQLYSGPVTLNSTATVRARTLDGGTWSAATEAVFTTQMLGNPTRITEIMYNPVGGSLYEFVELQNTSGVAAD
ncbi:MAG: lamin tail domain-containing protein, partial [Verrucomicrobia bacterium]|nr:lamin tail domain-containing protein [Verrucomicrobiota bacterium]